MSKDKDFLHVASKPGDGGRLLWVRLGNCRNDALLTAVTRSLDTIVAAFDSGQTVVELIWTRPAPPAAYQREGSSRVRVRPIV